MGIHDAAAASISGMWDRFDRCNSLIDWLQNGILEEDGDEFPAVLHNPTGHIADMHIVDSRTVLLERLEEARVHIDAARLLCQEVMAEAP